MRTATLHPTIGARNRPVPSRQLAWSIAGSLGITALLLGVGFLRESCLCGSPAVCWGLVGGGIVGTHLSSRGIAGGWLLLLSLQPMWVVYALSTEQYGFIVGSIAYGLGQLNGFLRSARG